MSDHAKTVFASETKGLMNMTTLTVDDRSLIVSMMQNLLAQELPDGTHLCTTDPAEAIMLCRDHRVDVAFLDIQMPTMFGLDLAEELMRIYPRINIIFITGYEEYMPQAFALYASGYLLKPIRQEALKKALAHLRYPPEPEQEQSLKVRCFGNFEIFCGDVPVSFPRSKCKELLAYLIDRNGAVCTTDMMLGALWPDRLPTDSLKSMLRTTLAEARRALASAGAPDILQRASGGIFVDPAAVDCDYYRFLHGETDAETTFRGEYMTQYDFAEETRAWLQMHA